MSVIVLHTQTIHRPESAQRSRKVGIIAVWHARYQYRQMLRDDLLLQPDSVLADAGITRVAAKCEAQKPFWRA